MAHLSQHLASSTIMLTEEQQEALDQIISWYSDQSPSCSKEFKLGGYAGTGKTTLLKYLKMDLGKRVAFAAFTGKACYVLTRKGVEASTIHSTIYYSQTKKDGSVEFTLKDQIEGNISLLVIDEASMISTELYNDLQSFGIKILFVGDPGQLEPVGDNPNLMRNPDYTLTKIHRQADASPIIHLANSVRVGGLIPRTSTGNLEIRPKNFDTNLLLSVDQVICAKNATRHKLNTICRKALGYTKQLEIGDKLICLQNSAQLNLFNGLILFVDEIRNVRPEEYLYECVIVTAHDETGKIFTNLPVWTLPFIQEVEKRDIAMRDRKIGYFDYGYAITCHKSQGSEWDSVLVVDEYMPPKIWSMARWRYTAITRAAKKLIYCI